MNAETDFEVWWATMMASNPIPPHYKPWLRQAWNAGYVQSVQDSVDSSKQLVGVHYNPQDIHEGQP